MSQDRNAPTLSPFTAMLLALVPALILVRCGLWPSFPDYRDAGVTDARTDAVVRPDVTSPDVTMPMDAAMDVAVDTPSSSDGGFRRCTAMPPSGPFTYERVFPMGGSVTGAKEIAFDGRGHVWTVGLRVTSIDSTGMTMDLGMTAVNGVGIRFLPNGDLAVASNSAMEGGTIKIVDRTGMVTTPVTGLRLPQSVAVDSTGAIYFTDSIDNAVYRLASGAMMPTVVTRDIQTPTGLALTPDFTRLFVGSSSTSRIYYVNLTASGAAIGMPSVYVDGSPNLSASGLAFDECGYLYASDRPRGRVVRVPPGGGSLIEIASDMTLLPVGLAFGRGTGFQTTSLYVMDSSLGNLHRLNVGVAGAAIVMPPM